MPQFFFDILRDGEDIARDHTGIDLPDLDIARIEAMDIWKRMISARAAGGADPLHWKVVILDADGTQLAFVPYPVGRHDDGTE